MATQQTNKNGSNPCLQALAKYLLVTEESIFHIGNNVFNAFGFLYVVVPRFGNVEYRKAFDEATVWSDKEFHIVAIGEKKMVIG